MGMRRGTDLANKGFPVEGSNRGLAVNCVATNNKKIIISTGEKYMYRYRYMEDSSKSN